MKDKIFNGILAATAAMVVLVGCGVFYALFSGAQEAFDTFGFWGFLFSGDWNPSAGGESYGAWPFLVGTLLTSALALAFCFPFAMPVALFVGEYFKGKRIAKFVGGVVDLLAGIPSIVYGLWGFYTLRPLMERWQLSDHGFGVLTASVILAVMIIPYAASLSAEFIRMVPNDLKEASYSLGCTQAETIRTVTVPLAAKGIFSAYILALGRALGETMAVTMLIGNTNDVPTSVFATGNTMASIIANQFGEADGLKMSSLIAVGFLLFLLTAAINIFGKMVMKRVHI